MRNVNRPYIGFANVERNPSAGVAFACFSAYMQPQCFSSFISYLPELYDGSMFMWEGVFSAVYWVCFCIVSGLIVYGGAH